MMMRAGELDRRITIQSRTVTMDSFGQEVETFPDWKTVWAKFEPRSGDEAFRAFQRSAEQTVIFRIRYVAGIQPRWRVLFDGELFDITDVAEVDRRSELVISATAREVQTGG